MVSFSSAEAVLVPSPKKGVAGGATPDTIPQIQISWFYNWAYIPGYTNPNQWNYNNWDPKIWEKFVPLFYGKGYSAVESFMNQICSKTDYCNKGNYYLVGNEPDVDAEDKTPGSTDPVGDAVFRQGEVVRRILAKDPTAKLIVLGLSNGSDLNFLKNFIIKWKDKWAGTGIASLPEVIRGWHFHWYFPNLPFVCPTDDSFLRRFVATANEQLLATFGKKIENPELWITEFGSLNRNATISQLKGLMSCLVPILENSAVVSRYAWFYHGCSSTVHSYCRTPWANYNLFYPQPAPLTISELGQRYALFGLVTPTPTPAPQPAKLSFKIKFQGINNAAPSKNVLVILKQGGVEKYRFAEVNVTADSSGVYSGLVENIAPGTYDVFIKGPIHLQKKFPNVTLNQGTNTKDFSLIPLKAGDFNNDNILNINDIASLLSYYTALSSPVNSQNQKFDIEANGAIDINDVSLVLANYTQREVGGE